MSTAEPAGPAGPSRAPPTLAQVADFNGLCRAARRAAKGKRLSHETLRFLCDLEPEALRLAAALKAGRYRPAPYRTFQVHDPKPRTISAAAFRDRVVHHALCAALEPHLEAAAASDSYACRPGKGGPRALARLQAHCREGGWFVKVDVERFFETADHGVLRASLAPIVLEPALRGLVDRFIDAGAPGSPPGKGLPIGNLTSQHFANHYLSALDHHLEGALGVARWVRYMDDLVCFVAGRAEAAALIEGIRAFASERLRLALRDDAERRGPVLAGVPFLGFRVWPGLVRLDAARQRRWRRRMAAALREPDAERRHARSQSLVAWSAHADARAWRQSFFARRAGLE